MAERRSSRRISVSFRAQFTPLFSRDCEGSVIELTTQGCRIQTSFPIPVNSYLELRLQLSSRDLPIVIELAAVRWVRASQCGIEFLALQPPQRTRLNKAIEEAVGQEEIG